MRSHASSLSVAVLTALIAVVGLAASSKGTGMLGARCVAGEMQIGGAYFNSGDLGEDIIGLVVTRDWVGACDDLVVITPEPYPLPDLYQSIEFQFTETPPELNKYFRYHLWLIDTGGGLHDPGPSGDVFQFDLAACGPATAVRGYLYDYGGGIGLDFCPDTCWYEGCLGPFDFSAIDPAIVDMYVNSGEPVNLRGEVFLDGMPGADCLRVDAIVPTGGDCGPVPAVPTSWSGVKMLYGG